MGDFGIKPDQGDLPQMRKFQKYLELQARKVGMTVAIKEMEQSIARSKVEKESIEKSIAELEPELKAAGLL